MTSPGPPPRWRRLLQLARLRTYRWSVHLFGGASLAGLFGAWLAFAASMTPSLLPRPWYLQGLASGAFVTLGYGVGAAASAILRRIGFDPISAPARRRLVFRAMLGIGVVSLPVFGMLGANWQHAVRLHVEVDPSDSYFYGLVLLMAAGVVWTTRAVLRLARYAVRSLGAWLSRWVPRRIAKLVAIIALLALLVAAVDEAVMPAVAKVANMSFSVTDRSTPDGAIPPTSPYRSGSPDSLVDWDSLGYEGRGFIASGPTVAELQQFSGKPAKEPIRAYAGLDSVPDSALADQLAAEADLVVEELHRTGAFERAVLVVAVPTGRGWVNPVGSAALEYVWNGDTAIAAMQYSFLPSVAALLTDQATPTLAGTILFEAVHAEWERLPEADRPLLISMGESLGAFGAQAAFDGIDNLLARADGAVWTGMPRFSPIWESVVAGRDEGSPEQHPVIDGCATVCFATAPGDLPADTHPRVVFLQHTNDPVVWWSTQLVLHKPEWLSTPPLPGRDGSMRWIPFITFWQVTMDLVVSTGTPDGQGHHYGSVYADAWAAVAAPPGWTESDTVRLRAILAPMPTGE